MDYITEETIRDLRSPRHTERLNAAIRLGQRRSPAAMNALLEAMYDNCNTVLLAVMEALFAYGEDAVPGLVLHLNSWDSSVRYAAASVLHEINSIHAEAALIARLEDDNEHVVRVAMAALARLNTPNARAALNRLGVV